MHKPRSLRSLTLNQNATTAIPGPPSPTLSEATQASQVNFGSNGPEKIITRADLKTSQQAYEKLLSTSAFYRDALMHMSKATAEFADAMEICATLKGTSYQSGSRLLAASGLHHLMANHWHILSDTIDKRFERPLRQQLETYRTTVSERSATYERALRERSRIIRQTEMENMNLGRKRNRNLQNFREALSVLQRQVEELDELRVAHYQEILEHEEEVWDFVQGEVSLVVRSTLDVVDRFSAKASDPVIEAMLQSIPDPFDSYGPPKSEDQIFSILAPLSIYNASGSPSPRTRTAEIDPSSSFSGSPVGALWTNEDNALDTSASEWADVDVRTSSPPLTAKSSAIVTINRDSSPPSSSRRASYPPGSKVAFPPIKSSGGLRKAESKLRKSLSAISEASSAEPRPEPGMRHESESGLAPAFSEPPFSTHRRDSSTETLRQPSRVTITNTNGSQSTFADEPIWSSSGVSDSISPSGEGGSEASSKTIINERGHGAELPSLNVGER